ncbi:MAG: glycosyltransferase family 2 protein [Candidatus Scalinduaceae bacterium]
METDQIDYSITIPVYNSERSLPELIKRLAQVMDKIGQPYEILLVNDASLDKSWQVIRQLKERYPQIRAFNLMNNVGQFRALMCAFDYVRGEYVITMDDDLQQPPEEITKLIKVIKTSPDLDCVFGIPQEKHHHYYRNLGTLLIRYINYKVFDKPKGLKTSSFRVFKRYINDTLVQYKTRNPVLNPLIIRSTKCIANVTVEHCERKYGTSGYSLSRLIKTTFDNVLNFSTLPLKFVSGLGLVASLGSILLTVFYAVRYFQGAIKVPGWVTLVLLLTFFSGLNLFSIGLVGEYLIRIIREVNHSPLYVVKDKL